MSALHVTFATELLIAGLPYTRNSLRKDLSGVSSVGKGTFVEAAGLYLMAQVHRVAVLFSVEKTLTSEF